VAYRPGGNRPRKCGDRVQGRTATRTIEVTELCRTSHRRKVLGRLVSIGAKRDGPSFVLGQHGNNGAVIADAVQFLHSGASLGAERLRRR